MDIGWTSKKTEQRNGARRPVGNTLQQYLLLHRQPSLQDGTRLDMVRGKQN
jgi:hypothetical protein